MSNKLDPAKDGPATCYLFRLPIWTHRELCALAEQAGSSRSEVLRDAIRDLARRRKVHVPKPRSP